MILDHSHDAYGEDCKIRGRYQSNGDEMYYIESVKPPIRFFDIDGSSLVFRPPVVKTFRFKKGQEVIITNRDRDSYNKKGVVVGDVDPSDDVVYVSFDGGKSNRWFFDKEVTTDIER